MYHHRHAFKVGIATAAFFGVLLMSGCSNSTGNSSTSSAEPTAVLGAAGSTFIAPIMTKWVSVYQQTHPTVQINYRPIGSGGGIEELKKGYLSFGASDAPLTDDQMKDMSPVIQVPDSAGPVCIVYNLPNLSAPLKLTAKTLSDIYLGNIISWQDPEIARDNPGVALPEGCGHCRSSFGRQRHDFDLHVVPFQGQPRSVLEVGSRLVGDVASRPGRRWQQRGPCHRQTDAGNHRLHGAKLRQRERRHVRFHSKPG